MKLPMVPPTNPPVYVGPLRTSSSSVNSTVQTTNYMGCGQTGGRSCRTSHESGVRARISAGLFIGIDREDFCGLPLPRPRRPSQTALGNQTRTLGRPRTGGSHDRYLFRRLTSA
jgi:hypothetical protein